MKKVILIGRSGCGKTSLLQRMNGEEIKYKKTQSIEISGHLIDTPGEYLEHKRMFRSLIVTSTEADMALLIHAADDDESTFFPGMSGILCMPIVGVITKIDKSSPAEIRQAEELLQMTGAEKVFAVSAFTGEGIEVLREYFL